MEENQIPSRSFVHRPVENPSEAHEYTGRWFSGPLKTPEVHHLLLPDNTFLPFCYSLHMILVRCHLVFCHCLRCRLTLDCGFRCSHGSAVFPAPLHKKPIRKQTRLTPRNKNKQILYFFMESPSRYSICLFFNLSSFDITAVFTAA